MLKLSGSRRSTMANLNIRERMVETTIAYVGDDDGASLATAVAGARGGNPAVVVERELDGHRVRATEWRPRHDPKLLDCELVVTLVSPVDVEPSAVERLLVDADGLVLLLDDHPESFARSARAATVVRDALARTPGKRVPVVVQVNERTPVEGSDGGAPDVASLVDGGWTRVSTSAAKGDGGMETLQRAVDAVVETMQTQSAVAASARPALRTDGNPLLAALRQILQASLAEQLAELEDRLSERLRERAAAENDLERATTERLAALDARLLRVESALTDSLEALSAATNTQRESLLAELRDARKTTRDELARVAASISTVQRVMDAQGVETKKVAAAQASADALARLDAKSEAMRERVDALAADAGATSQRLDGVASETRAQRDALSSEARAHREALAAEVREARKAVRDDVARVAATITPLQRTVDALAVEAKRWMSEQTAVADTLTHLEANVESVRARVESLHADAATAAAKLDGIAATKVESDARLGARFAELREALKALGHEVEARSEALGGEVADRSEALRAAVAALIEEMQKSKKKGWF